MRRLTSLLPYLPVLIVVAWLATRFRPVLGLFLIAHGLVHLLYVVPEPERKPGAPEWPFHLDRSWALSRLGVGPGTLRAIGILLMAVTIVGFAVAGIGLLANVGWWSAATIAAASVSAALLVLFFDPTLALGLAINTFLVSVTASLWPALSYANP